MVISGMAVLIVAVAIGLFMSKGKAEGANEDIDIKEPTKIAIEQKVEYGEDIVDKTFTIHIEDETKEANFSDLDSDIDTMTVGNTEHTLELEDIIFDVTVVVEDTKKPIIKGVQDVIELEGEEVDIEEELKKLMTAEDPVDGELDIVFEIEEDKDKENNYNVTVEATDENDHKTIEIFKVVVKVIEKEEKADKKDEEDKSSSVASKSENDPKPKQENPKEKKTKEEKPKQENPKKEEPKQEEPKQENPKQEEPKPEKDSSSGPSIGKPVSPVPKGASMISNRSDETTYSYNKTLPGGGKINEVSVFVEGSEKLGVMVRGLDNAGESFMGLWV